MMTVCFPSGRCTCRCSLRAESQIVAADETRRSWKPRFNDSSVPLGQSLCQPGCLVEEDLARDVRHLSAVGAWPGADNRRVDGLVEAAKEFGLLSERHGWKVREIVARKSGFMGIPGARAGMRGIPEDRV